MTVVTNSALVSGPHGTLVGQGRSTSMAVDVGESLGFDVISTITSAELPHPARDPSSIEIATPCNLGDVTLALVTTRFSNVSLHRLRKVFDPDAIRLLWQTCRSRALKIIAEDCLSSFFTATNRIVGLRAASQIASAFAASFFCRLTKGFT